MQVKSKIFAALLVAHLKSIDAKPYNLVHWAEECIDPATGKAILSEQYLYKLCGGRSNPPEDKTLEKLASIPELKLDISTLKAWRARDQYEAKELIESIETMSDQEFMDALREKYPDKKRREKFARKVLGE